MFAVQRALSRWLPALLVGASLLAFEGPRAAAGEAVRRGSGWTVTLKHPDGFQKGEEVQLSVEVSGPEVQLTNSYELTVRIYEKDRGPDDVVRHRARKQVEGRTVIEEQEAQRFVVSVPPDGQNRAIRRTLTWSTILSSYELVGGVELYVVIEAKKLGGRVTQILPGFSGAKDVIKIKRVRDKAHERGCPCDDH